MTCGVMETTVQNRRSYSGPLPGASMLTYSFLRVNTHAIAAMNRPAADNVHTIAGSAEIGPSMGEKIGRRIGPNVSLIAWEMLSIVRPSFRAFPQYALHFAILNHLAED